MDKNELVIVIPAYEPNHLLVELINKLNGYFTDFTMVVVNDGSKGKEELFNEVKSLPNVVLLEHEVNRGKGVALKTAFEHISKMEGHHIIVTADSDGQHKPEDIFRVSEFYKKYNDGLILGSRKFEGEIPVRSTFGNNVARGLLKLCNSKHLNDTQTGLRAFGSELLPFMLSTKGDRYEYEMNMLVECARQNIDIHEIAIATIYINNNEGSHFRPVRDFTRICSCIIKYTLPLFLTTLLNILAFVGFYFAFKNSAFVGSTMVILATASSCVFSLIFNLIVNYLGVFYGNPYLFKNKNKCITYILKYLVLIFGHIFLVLGLYLVFNNVALAKTLTEILALITISLLSYFTAQKSVLHEE